MVFVTETLNLAPRGKFHRNFPSQPFRRKVRVGMAWLPLHGSVLFGLRAGEPELLFHPWTSYGSPALGGVTLRVVPFFGGRVSAVRPKEKARALAWLPLLGNCDGLS